MHKAVYRQAGLSLVELMVALVLGLLLLGAVLQFYLGHKQTYVAQEQNGILQESGRFALEFVARDARMAGLIGCSSRRPPNLPLPIRNYLNSSDYVYAFDAGVRGHEAVGTGVGDSHAVGDAYPPAAVGTDEWSPPAPAFLAGRAIAGSDVLVLHEAGVAGTPLVDPYTSGAQIFVDTPNDIVAGDILLVTDCSQAQIFQATGVSGTGANVVGSQAGTFTPGNLRNIAERGPVGPFRQGSEVSRLRTYTFFVGVGADGAPALLRREMARASADELISGVDSMQLTYGIEDGSDYRVERYVAADEVDDWSKVRAVRIALLVRSPEPFLSSASADDFDLAGTTVVAPADRRQRRVFASTIALRNRLL